MKLSTLVAYLNQLDDLLPLQGQAAVHQSLEPMLHLVQSSSVQFADNTVDVLAKFNNIQQSITQFDQSVLELRKQLKQEIENHETQYYARSYQLYDEEMCHDTPELILNRRLNLAPQVREKVLGRISLYNEWKHPGMIIRPGHEDWVSEMVGLDPLYLVDDSWDMFEPVKKRFNELYLSRLCFYTTKEREGNPILQSIPNGQIKFCLAYNFFNYKPLEVIRRYLDEIYQKLKPGGVVAFTFNDCDRSAGVELAERCFMCFTPASMIVALSESLGYEVGMSMLIDASNHWLELRKPGELHSIRGGQSLASVFEKPGL
jgi:SAM-dependent methyltransferase